MGNRDQAYDLEGAIKATAAIMRSRATAHDSNIELELESKGIDKRTAHRCVLFLPLAYGRVLLSNLGIRFSDNYRTRMGAHLFNSDPIWVAVARFVETELSQGLSKEDLLLVAARSAEIDAVNQLLQRGSRAEDVRLDAPRIDSLE